jgi:hypothetical protein
VARQAGSGLARSPDGGLEDAQGGIGIALLGDVERLVVEALGRPLDDLARLTD